MISERAKDMAKRFRTGYDNDPTKLAYFVQERSELDGKHHWIIMPRIQLERMEDQADLEALCECMLINHGIIERPNQEPVFGQPGL